MVFDPVGPIRSLAEARVAHEAELELALLRGWAHALTNGDPVKLRVARPILERAEAEMNRIIASSRIGGRN